MHPTLLYYLNLALCGLVCIELLVTFRKNPLLRLYFLLIIASVFMMNYFAVTGVHSRVQLIVVKFSRLVYVCSTLLTLIHFVQPKIPRWVIALIVFSAIAVTGLRLVYFNQINPEALINNPVFTVGGEFYSPKPVARYIIIAMSIASIIIGYYYYQRLLMKLNRESVHYKPLLRWIISLVVPFFLLIIFGILGNLRIFNETLSSYLFALFSCTTICSFVFRPRSLGAALDSEFHEPASAVVG